MHPVAVRCCPGAFAEALDPRTNHFRKRVPSVRRKRLRIPRKYGERPKSIRTREQNQLATLPIFSDGWHCGGAPQGSVHKEVAHRKKGHCQLCQLFQPSTHFGPWPPDSRREESNAFVNLFPRSAVLVRFVALQDTHSPCNESRAVQRIATICTDLQRDAHLPVW